MAHNGGPLIAAALRVFESTGATPASDRAAENPRAVSLLRRLIPSRSSTAPASEGRPPETRAADFLARVRDEHGIDGGDTGSAWPLFVPRYSMRYTHSMCRAYFFEATEDVGGGGGGGRISTIFLTFASNLPAPTSVEHLASAVNLPNNRENHQTTRDMVFRSNDFGARPPPAPTRESGHAFELHELYEASITEHLAAWHTASESVRSIDLASMTSASARAVRGFLAKGNCATTCDGIGTGRIVEVCETIATGLGVEHAVRNMYLVHADNPMCWTLLSCVYGTGPRKQAPVFPDELLVPGGGAIPPHLVGTPLLLARHNDELVEEVFHAWTLLQMRVNAMCDRIDVLPSGEPALADLLRDASFETVRNITFASSDDPCVAESGVVTRWVARDARGDAFLPSWWSYVVPPCAVDQVLAFVVSIDVYDSCGSDVEDDSSGGGGGGGECVHTHSVSVHVPFSRGGRRAVSLSEPTLGIRAEVDIEVSAAGSHALGSVGWTEAGRTHSRAFNVDCLSFPSADFTRSVCTDPVLVTFLDGCGPDTVLASRVSVGTAPVWECSPLGTSGYGGMYVGATATLSDGAVETADWAAVFRRSLRRSNSGRWRHLSEARVVLSVRNVGVSTSPLAAHSLAAARK